MAARTGRGGRRTRRGGPATLPDSNILTNGAWYGGSPYLGPDATVRAVGSTGTTPPSGTIANPPASEAGFAFMWHSHNEREITTNNIFPGGMLPCPAALNHAARDAGFAIETARTFANSYADTLKEWRTRFHAQWTNINAQGFDERFRRMWDYYLAYCEGGFRSKRGCAR